MDHYSIEDLLQEAAEWDNHTDHTDQIAWHEFVYNSPTVIEDFLDPVDDDLPF
jgi:hypothetical protein